ncbi:unnamed protein product [Phytomonas sp. Hart1]|nr:unnamed protein product [Phytomonas sp. Hart1]|eukprot:CCW71797.1 unnamed protein product [Phytomonas sp. isolate Hart1]
MHPFTRLFSVLSLMIKPFRYIFLSILYYIHSICVFDSIHMDMTHPCTRYTYVLRKKGSFYSSQHVER